MEIHIGNLKLAVEKTIPKNEVIDVVATRELQVFTPNEGYDGIGKVNLSPIALGELDSPAIASDILENKGAYDKTGALITGTIPIYSGSNEIGSNCLLEVGGKYVPSDIKINVQEENPYFGLVDGTIVSFAMPPNKTAVKPYLCDEATSLKTIDLSGAESIGDYAFRNCNSVNEIVFSTTSATIGEYAFYGLENVSSCDFDKANNITSLGRYAFTGFGSNRPNPSENILTLDFSNSTFTNIPKSFLGTYGSNDKYISKYVKTIFPPTVISIEVEAFGYTRNCEFYFTSATPPKLFSSNSWSNATNYTIFVPYNNVADYRTATNWTTCSAYIKGFSPANTFTKGEVLPVMSKGYEATWYKDKECTIPVTTVEDVSVEYYCLVGTTRIAYEITEIKEKNCVVTITDGVNNYSQGDWIKPNTNLTISAVTTVQDYVLKYIKINDVAYKNGDTFPITNDIKIKVEYFDGITYPIYGVSGEGASSPVLTRTDDAVGLGYTIGTSEITSDFDNCYPWSDMTEYTDSMGNKFIKIPKFYTQYTFKGSLKTTRISEMPEDDTWVLNPIFTDGNGNELDYFCIGKYLAGLNGTKLTSVSGVSPKCNATRASFRTYARNNGTGYQLMDIWAVTALQDLFKIEFATINSQSIMKGYTDGSATITSGRTDLVATASGSPISNTSGKYAMKYRGIENFYGNVHQFVDGININNYYSYVCYKPANYKDDTGINYTKVSYRNRLFDGYVTKLGYDEANPFVHIPTDTDFSSSTYYGDCYYQNSGWRVALFGGYYSDGTDAGAFFWDFRSSLSTWHSTKGGRLLYRPL